MSEYLPDQQIADLRKNNVISDSEVVIKLGDLFVAENVLTRNRRTLDLKTVKNNTTSTMSEGKPEQKLLKD